MVQNREPKVNGNLDVNGIGNEIGNADGDTMRPGSSGSGNLGIRLRSLSRGASATDGIRIGIEGLSGHPDQGNDDKRGASDSRPYVHLNLLGTSPAA